MVIGRQVRLQPHQAKVARYGARSAPRPTVHRRMGRLSEIDQGYRVACFQAGIDERGEWVVSIAASGI